MKLKIHKRFAKIVATICFLLLIFNNYKTCADTKFSYPIIIYPDHIIICFMPFEKVGSNSFKQGDIRNEIIQKLEKNGDFNYTFITPRRKLADQIYENGFFYEDSKSKLTKKYPNSKYWSKSNVNYIVFGSYQILDETSFILEFFLYDPKNKKLLISKRFSGNLAQFELLKNRLCAKIEKTLEKYNYNSKPPFKK